MFIPTFVAIRLSGDVGQNHEASSEHVAIDVSLKDRLLVPESMKLPGMLVPLNVVVRSPLASSVRTFALPSALLDCVPMPKTSEPASVAAPVAGTVGNSMMAPFLSWAKKAMGFDTCAATATSTSAQVLGVAQE